ncbi:DUF3325 domain-containing protein [Alteromonas pelagimontana]|uniref:DUF3325 domain-containing protein n=1 Tax=Alteromonas pelagimontana TaxID=1858656 RepID=A0A6M4MCD8_9ALTE|nr:DUF3325 domain-containing protein [Alteromonas pelagimontana]QJR80709.1 DUF3325 domain-containing protein [Alteromonas pelagimontana]
MIMLAGWLTNLLGFWLFALAMPRNRKWLIARKFSSKQEKVARNAGFALLLVSLWCVLRTSFIGDAIVIWCYMLTISALLITGIIAFKQQR